LLKALRTAGIDDIKEARKNMMATVNDAEKSKAIDEGVKDQTEHIDNLGLHIGYIYSDTSFPGHASHLEASFASGSRLPHAWLTGPLPAELPQPKVSGLS
jgi:hypothetical protein